MPRKLRVQYPGAIYHVMSRGNGKQDIFRNDVDRQDFVKTLAETCQKTGFQVHAWCLMRNHFHLVAETPNANLVAGMKWLLSVYTIRFNHRHQRLGHVLSGRYKALVVDGSSSGYLRTVCDYVHLNPVRAKLLRPEQRLLEYPWSSFGGYLAAQAHRPEWLRVDRLLGEHGIQADSAAGRRQFEQRMEAQRAGASNGAEWRPIRRGWCFGTPDFKAKLLEQMEGKLGEHHAGELKRESAEAKAERIIQEELKRRRWTEADLNERAKSDPAKLALAARVRRETTLTIRWIAGRLHLGSWKSLNAKLHRWKRTGERNHQ
ncbi:MAG: transposase [Verrucomicrobia bacterium]|nr:transposase [Verrucomicrobiota bacterium]